MSKFKQGDIVVMNFDPSIGEEIRKRRPAVVISSDKYNLVSDLIIVSPITSELKDLPTRFNLNGYQDVEGQVNTMQIYSGDSVKREAKKVDHMKDHELLQVLQLLGNNFDLSL
ncbi:MAG: type II toxin-antitoxin system PemK/MazF family toxin [Lactobacillaceae bacterium]|jgi:mRNA interferase MazF|nr:type II toxin-antitoxin system PemK/MazF family toxin [Lactobacillaceae bacterium]